MKILVIDDDSGIRHSLSNFLRNIGHIVSESDNGNKALDILKNEKFHLVLSDIRIPGMDGHKLLKQIKKSPELNDLVVVLFTGYGEVKSAVEAMRNGAYDYLLKPIHMKELVVLTEKIGEYIALRQENIQFKENFELQVHEATRDIQKELAEVREAYARQVGVSEIGIFSESFNQVFKIAEQLHHNREIPVLIEGETGTGKEVIARFIHYGSGEVTSPFLGINCAALSPNLFESELFGYEAGAFTGGNPKGQKGKLELAKGGSIFFDEIGEIGMDFQAKLLRVIQEREYYRVGGLKKFTTDARVICSTNKDINKSLAEGSFRMDLYYRLKAGHIRIKPLRERREDILPLAKMFLLQLHEQKKNRFVKISNTAGKILTEYNWPGNVRELKSTIERIVLLCDDIEVRPEHLEFLLQDSFLPQSQSKMPDDFLLPDSGFDLNAFILDVVKKALVKHKGKKTEAARFLGISRYVLQTYLKRIREQN